MFFLYSSYFSGKMWKRLFEKRPKYRKKVKQQEFLMCSFYDFVILIKYDFIIYSRIISNTIYLDAYYHPELCDHTWENKALSLFINVC